MLITQLITKYKLFALTLKQSVGAKIENFGEIGTAGRAKLWSNNLMEIIVWHNGDKKNNAILFHTFIEKILSFQNCTNPSSQDSG